MVSWKGQLDKSGGLATNIGIHFFDLLMWLFGKVEHTEVHISNSTRVAGKLELTSARVKWFLSIDKDDLPPEAVKEGQRTYRSISVDGDEIEFSGGFTDLHTLIYKDVLEGRGFGLDEARPSIELAHQLRVTKPIGITPDSHSIIDKIKSQL